MTYTDNMRVFCKGINYFVYYILLNCIRNVFIYLGICSWCSAYQDVRGINQFEKDVVDYLCLNMELNVQ